MARILPIDCARGHHRRVRLTRHPSHRTAGAALLRAIAAELPDLRLLTDAVDREAYRNDETAYLQAGLPLAVALPESTAQVVDARPAAPPSIASRSCRAAPAPG